MQSSIYSKTYTEVSGPLDSIGAVRNLVENAAAATFTAWRGIALLDHIALAEVGTREDFDDLEFLINRSLGELNGLKNAVTLARRLA